MRLERTWNTFTPDDGKKLNNIYKFKCRATLTQINATNEPLQVGLDVENKDTHTPESFFESFKVNKGLVDHDPASPSETQDPQLLSVLTDAPQSSENWQTTPEPTPSKISDPLTDSSIFTNDLNLESAYYLPEDYDVQLDLNQTQMAEAPNKIQFGTRDNQLGENQKFYYISYEFNLELNIKIMLLMINGTQSLVPLPETSSPEKLRITREGDSLTFFYRDNGDWIEAGSTTGADGPHYIRIAAANQPTGTTNEPLFENVNVIAGDPLFDPPTLTWDNLFQEGSDLSDWTKEKSNGGEVEIEKDQISLSTPGTQPSRASIEKEIFEIPLQYTLEISFTADQIGDSAHGIMGIVENANTKLNFEVSKTGVRILGTHWQYIRHQGMLDGETATWRFVVDGNQDNDALTIYKNRVLIASYVDISPGGDNPHRLNILTEGKDTPTEFHIQGIRLTPGLHHPRVN